MKFLTKEDWEQLENNKNNEKIESLYFDITQKVKDNTASYFDHNTFGIAMTLFHYYTCFHSIRNLDPIELGFACLYMSSKIQFFNYPITFFIKQFKDYTKKFSDYNKKPEPDFIKYEIELYSLLGYDLDIETPFQVFYKMLPSFYEMFPSMREDKKMNNLKSFCFNLINDTYCKPLCIYFHPKIIYLSCMIFSVKFLEFNECDLNILLKGENIDLVFECMNRIFHIYSKFINEEDIKNKTNITTTFNKKDS